MNKIDFYNKLADESIGTIDIDGTVLVGTNNNKWHVCKNSGGYVSYVCERGGPSNPNRNGAFDDEYYTSIFNNSTECCGVKESIEYDRVCSNCLRKIEDEYDLRRMVIAVPDDPEPDATKGLVERFVERLSES